MSLFFRYFNVQVRPFITCSCPRYMSYMPLSSWQYASKARFFPKDLAFKPLPPTRSTINRAYVAGGIGLGLTISLYGTNIYCDARSPASPSSVDPALQLPAYPNSLPPPPTSSVNLFELSFGTVAGICAGVFVKKGAKAVAFFVGGIFVLLQYFVSLSLVRVDWGRATGKFENLFYTTGANGVKQAPTVVSLWKWLVNFITADFQPRASFLAGFILGIRIG